MFLCTLFGSPAMLAKLLERSAVLRAGRAKFIPTLIVLMPSTGEAQGGMALQRCNGATVQQPLCLVWLGWWVAASRRAAFTWCLLSVAETQCVRPISP